MVVGDIKGMLMVVGDSEGGFDGASEGRLMVARKSCIEVCDNQKANLPWSWKFLFLSSRALMFNWNSSLILSISFLSSSIPSSMAIRRYGKASNEALSWNL